MPTIQFTGDAEADQLLSDDPFALLLGMLLDQQVPMERAFAAPARLQERLGHLDPARIAAMDVGALEEVFRIQPALHRFPGSMAKRTKALCEALVTEHDGRAEHVWESADDGRALKRALKALPGYGDQKARIFVALLAKRCGVAPEGWEQAAGEYAEDGHRSIADVDSPEAVEAVREFKKARKAGRA